MDKRTFINPDFVAEHQDVNLAGRLSASGLAYQVWGLIRVIEIANSCETSGIPHEHRGIEVALDMAAHMAADLIDRCEEVEAL